MEKERRAGEARARLAEALSRWRPAPGGLRDVTSLDLVLATGLAEAEVLALLPGLAAEYGARVAATEAGRVLWRFPADLESRRRTGLLRGFARKLAKASRRSAEILIEFGYSSWAYLAYLLLGSRRAAESPILHGRSLSYNELVLSFVFGGPDPDADRRGVEGRDFLAWAAERRGLVSAEEYALRSGLTLDEAEERLALFAAEYGGEPRALGAGLLAWYFPAARRRASAAPPPPTFRRMLPFSDNPPPADRAAAISGGASLLFGALTIQSVLAWLGMDSGARDASYALETFVTFLGLFSPGTTLALLGVLPFLAGLAGIVAPIARQAARIRENAARRRENARMAAGHRILESGGVLRIPHDQGPVNGTRERAPSAADRRPRREGGPRGHAAARLALDRLAAEFGATISMEVAAGPGPIGEIRSVYVFPRIVDALEALEAARASLPPCDDISEDGPIVFDSGDP